ncbi:ABC-2 family transporter protein [Candidatus Saccharibacteria bacterium]|nr:ABC-2 family transporter protein [Candidatus Saccharibacteria bacterium]MBP7834606.1 ABC-2 family transporter protein [Candidatus Saccharibacteria bacterium]
MYIKNAKLLYFMVAFEARRFQAFPIEIIASVARRIIEITLYITFWLIVSNYSSANINSRDIISYYLIITGITSFFFTQLGAGSQLISIIKTGELNQILIKPMPALLSPFSTRAGRNIINYAWGGLQIVAGIIIAGGIGDSNWLLFPLILINTFLINIALNIFVGTLGFYFIEAGGIKNVVVHITTICGGLLIPLFLMPQNISNALQIFTPFPASQYQMAIFLQGKYPLNSWFVLIGLIWAIVLILASLKFWKYSLRHYEATGA